MLDTFLSELDEKMNKTVESLKKELSSVRTGRANPALLDRIEIEYYGTPTNIKQVANVTVPDARTLLIQPFDKATLSLVDKAIQKSDLGIMPQNDGQFIRICIPQLTQERRKELVKVVKKIAEEGKVALRNERRTIVDKIKKQEKDKKNPISQDDSKKIQDKVQKVTDSFIETIDSLSEKKEKEVLEM